MAQIIVNDLTFGYDTSYDNVFKHVSFDYFPFEIVNPEAATIDDFY